MACGCLSDAAGVLLFVCFSRKHRTTDGERREERGNGWAEREGWQLTVLRAAIDQQGQL